MKSLQQIMETSTTNPSESSAVSIRRDKWIAKFGNEREFLLKVNADSQIAFGNNPERSIMGDYPTLFELDGTYGKNFSAIWLVAQLDDLSSFAGAKNITEQQQYQLARIIATEFHYLKITELLLFFYRFKTGRYGRFYGSVDPMTITCAIRDFLRDRNDLIALYEHQEEPEPTQRGDIYTIIKENPGKYPILERWASIIKEQ